MFNFTFFYILVFFNLKLSPISKAANLSVSFILICLLWLFHFIKFSSKNIFRLKVLIADEFKKNIKSGELEECIWYKNRYYPIFVSNVIVTGVEYQSNLVAKQAKFV